MTVLTSQQFEVELIERELVSVELTQIDVINNTKQFEDSLKTYLVDNEIPVQLTSKIFQTANNYIAENLIVYFNGIKEKYINKLSDNTFSFNIDIIVGDKIEISYIKKS